MDSLNNVLNHQIRRLARREITGESRIIRKLTAQHRRDIAALKRQIASLQRSVAFLERQEKRRVSGGGAGAAAAQAAPEAGESLRFRADGLRSHRARLGLSAKDYGRLVGVSGLTVYHWEAGKSRPRQAQLQKVARVRGLGKREAERRLALLDGKR